MENTKKSSENKMNVEVKPSKTPEPEQKMPINPNMDEANN